jgi:peptidoglycan/LPS O-acetylase OafA/YrhL
MGRWLAAFVVGGWVVLAVVTAIWGTGGVHLAYFHLHGHLVELFAGGLLAWAVLQGLPATVRRVASNPLVPLVALGILMAAAWKISSISSPLMLVVYPVLALASVSLIAHLVVQEHGWAHRLFGHPVARWLGKRSYAFYLWHLPILDLVEEHTSHMKVAIAVALPLSLLAAEISWRLVETPALRLKDRFQRVPTEPAPAAA